MSFTPISPLSGVAGWRFLERTEASQRAAFDRDAQLDRDIVHFKEKISKVLTAGDLVKDRQLMRVALGAFGLDEEIGKTFFIRKVLEEGTENPRSLANRFVDPRYAELSRAFGFGNLSGPRTRLEGFPASITEAYRERQFEIAVGNVHPDMRLAMGFRRQIAEYANSQTSEGSAWFRIMGSTPLRTVFEAAYNLPSEFAQLDVDRQRDVLRDKTRELFGDSSVAVFRDPEVVGKMIDRFLVRRQIQNGPSDSGSGSAALSLLQSMSAGGSASARINLILSGS